MPKEIIIPGLPPIKTEQAISTVITVITLLLTLLGSIGIFLEDPAKSDKPSVSTVANDTKLADISKDELLKTLSKKVEAERQARGIATTEFGPATSEAERIASAANSISKFGDIDNNKVAAVGMALKNNPTVGKLLEELAKSPAWTNADLPNYGVGVKQTDDYTYAVVYFMNPAND